MTLDVYRGLKQQHNNNNLRLVIQDLMALLFYVGLYKAGNPLA